MDSDALLFLNDHPEAVSLYLALEDWIIKYFPQAKMRVQKTQITFYSNCVFACVSFARV